MVARVKESKRPKAATPESTSEEGTDPLTSASMTTTQHEDVDLQLIITALETGKERPALSEMTSASTEAKHYWSQWELLRMRDGVLQRR